MSEFKYACPVCGQHIKCDSSQAGSVMECPTCFQKITVPQAPETADSKFIITGTKVGERPAPTIPEYRAVEAEKNSPLAVVVALVFLVGVVGAAAYVFRGQIFKSSAPVTPTNQLASGSATGPGRTAVNQPAPAAAPRRGGIGLGSWETEVEYSNVIVTKGTDTLYQSDFQPGAAGWQILNGQWIATNNVFIQTAATQQDARAVTGDTAWRDYTLSLKARKLAGKEGFLIMFNVQDDQNWTWWNLGGWGDTKNAIETCAKGVKSTLVETNQPQITTGVWYDIRVELRGTRVRCYLNDTLIHDAVYPTPAPPARASAALPLTAPPANDTNWTMDLAAATTPDSLAAGRIHGKDFICERAYIESGALMLRLGRSGPVTLGLAINFGVEQPEALANQSVNVTTNAPKAALVTLRYLGDNEKLVKENFTNGYALRLKFNPQSGNRISGKIYFCAPDDSKSYVMGTFNAEIRRPRPRS